MKITLRGTHRDFGYFFVGLIIAFAISGIFLNHRGQFNAREYTTSVEPVTIAVPASPDRVNDAFVDSLSGVWDLRSSFRGWRMREGTLRITYDNVRFEIDMQTGKGEKESFRKVPFIAQFMQLHQDTSDWWIYYSDVFGLGMLTIATTGMFIQKGSKSFRKRGWIIAGIGIIFPLIFLFLLS